MVGRTQTRRLLTAAILLTISVIFLLSRSSSQQDVVAQLATEDEQIPPSSPDASSDNPIQPSSQHLLDEPIVRNRHVQAYREIYSLTTSDRKYIPVLLGALDGSNANIIPHPTNANFWILIVTREMNGMIEPSQELACTAAFQHGTLICTEDTTPLPLVSSATGNCTDNLSFVSYVWGARDARVFYGPEIPYIIYGSQSSYICFGQWLQDIRQVLPHFHLQKHISKHDYADAVELRRSWDYGMMEKNYFLFWDDQGQIYAHYSLMPRHFAQIDAEGKPGRDLAADSAVSDRECMAKFMPKYAWADPAHEAIHQATNSLAVTMCLRGECVADDENTFLMHVFHLKTYYENHAQYWPYTVLFRRRAPFEVYAIAQQPLWIHGREEFTEKSDAVVYREKPETIPKNHTEMFYVTSMSWKSHVQKYHGFLDDVLFLGFGIEDSRPGIIDVEAGDLLQDLAYC